MYVYACVYFFKLQLMLVIMPYMFINQYSQIIYNNDTNVNTFRRLNNFDKLGEKSF